MKQPGDIDTDSIDGGITDIAFANDATQLVDLIPEDVLDPDYEATVQEAVALAKAMGAEDAHSTDVMGHQGETVYEIDLSFVLKTLDLGTGDLFRIEGYADSRDDAHSTIDGVHKVTSSVTYTGELEVSHPEYTEGVNDGWDSVAIDEIGFPSTETFFQLWLNGQVTPVKAETRYIDVESGEEVEV